MNKTISALTAVSSVLTDIAGLALFFLMTMTMIDIVGRNLGLLSVRGIIEMSTMAVIFVGFLALPTAYFGNKHIVIDLLSNHLPRFVNEWLDRLWWIVGAIFLTIGSCLMWKATIRVYETNEVSPDLHLPMVWLWVPASVGFTMSSLASLLMGFTGAGQAGKDAGSK